MDVAVWLEEWEDTVASWSSARADSAPERAFDREPSSDFSCERGGGSPSEIGCDLGGWGRGVCADRSSSRPATKCDGLSCVGPTRSAKIAFVWRPPHVGAFPLFSGCDEVAQLLSARGVGGGQLARRNALLDREVVQFSKKARLGEGKIRLESVCARYDDWCDCGLKGPNLG